MSAETRNMLRWLGRSIGSLAVVATIVVALVAGVWLGRMSAAKQPPPADAAHDDASATLYTCSMHPQIRLPDPGAKCPICFMALIPVEAGAGDEMARTLVMTTASMALAEVQTEPVRREFPLAQVRMVGRVEYDETRLATIAAYFPGRLDRLYLDATGAPVRRGEHVAEMYSPELLAAQEELRQAGQAVASMESASPSVRMATEATLQAARGKLRLWGLTDEQIASIESSEQPLRTVTLYAPISGVVLEKRAVEGRYVSTGEEIYRLADLDHVWVWLDAYESDLPLLRYGQRARFTTDALPGEAFEGLIAFIAPVVDAMSRTVKVRVHVDNRDRSLKPGMFVRATVEAEVGERGVVVDASLAGLWICPMHPEETAEQAGACSVCGMDLAPAADLGYVVDPGSVEAPLTIPVTAALVTGRRAVVYVRDPDEPEPTFTGREVTLGPRAGDRYIVREGLREGELVVTDGAFKIDSALQIRAEPSMMQPPDDAREKHDDAIDTPPAFLQSLQPVYEAYLDAQEALADDDLEAFRAAARQMRAATTAVDPAPLSRAASSAWSEARAGLLTSAEHLDHFASLAEARVPFEDWSNAILQVAARFGHLEPAALHEAFCPMAFDNRGASWLQRGETIDNPYFGAEMLLCGEFRRAFEPRRGDQ